MILLLPLWEPKPQTVPSIKCFLQRHWVLTSAIAGVWAGGACLMAAGIPNGLFLSIFLVVLNVIVAISTPEK